VSGRQRPTFSERFVEGDAHCIREIERADTERGDAPNTLGMGFEDLARQTDRLAPENQCVARLEVGVQIAPLRLRAEEMDASRVRNAVRSPIDMPPHVQEVPVVHACPANRVLVDRETELADEMERAPGGDTRAGDGAGVGRDLRLDENDMERGLERTKSKLGSSRHGASLTRGARER
jgi:hypothetical protein